jgi:hypothetical protein
MTYDGCHFSQQELCSIYLSLNIIQVNNFLIQKGHHLMFLLYNIENKKSGWATKSLTNL